jgi:hypothetical protein
MIDPFTTSVPSTLQAVRAEIQRLEAQLDQLRQDEQALLAAEKVIRQYQAQVVKNVQALEQQHSIKSTRSRSGSPRPDGVPTLPEMIRLVLMAAAKEGEPALTGAQIRDRIAKRWWPGVGHNLVTPTAWRLADTGRLKKEGTAYSLPDNEKQLDLQKSLGPENGVSGP